MWKQIFKTALIAGMLDITAACVQAYISKAISPEIVLKYIASGLFGKDAFAGGFAYAMAGLLIHFLIAFTCTVAYFLIYPKIKFLHRSVLLSAFLIAIIAWAITARIIVPLSKINPAAFNITKAIIAIAILYFCIGLPIAYFTNRYYKKNYGLNLRAN